MSCNNCYYSTQPPFILDKYEHVCNHPKIKDKNGRRMLVWTPSVKKLCPIIKENNVDKL